MFDTAGFAGINAIHCACINPNKKYLEALYNFDNNIHINDSINRKPVHYASACESSEPLKFLIEHGDNVLELDKERSSTLHYAAKYGRPDNDVRVLLDTAPSLLKLKDKSKMLAFHYALMKGYIETVKAFIEKGFKINTPSGNDRMHGLSYAAGYNQYEMCEYLIENKARVLSKDKYKRSALIMAVRNGNSKIVNLLLRKGAL
jgi:ankyrin repeat protein